MVADEATARLIAEAKAGHERAIERLWQLNAPALHQYLSRYLRDPRDVSEAAQEVFIRMHRALPEFEERETPFQAWLFRIGRNHAIDLLRREKHSRVEADERLHALLEAGAAPPEASMDGWLRDEGMAEAFAELPIEQRRALTLRFVFGYPSEEAAELLGCSPAAVRQQQSRGLRRLGEALAGRTDTA